MDQLFIMGLVNVEAFQMLLELGVNPIEFFLRYENNSQSGMNLFQYFVRLENKEKFLESMLVYPCVQEFLKKTLNSLALFCRHPLFFYRNQESSSPYLQLLCQHSCPEAIALAAYLYTNTKPHVPSIFERALRKERTQELKAALKRLERMKSQKVHRQRQLVVGVQHCKGILPHAIVLLKRILKEKQEPAQSLQQKEGKKTQNPKASPKKKKKEKEGSKILISMLLRSG